MKITRRQLKTLIKKNLYESVAGLYDPVTGLSRASQPTSIIAAHWSELTGADPTKLTKLIEDHIKSENPNLAINGVALAIGLGVIPEDEILSVAYNSQNGWKQDGVNWYLLQEFPNCLFWQTVTSLNLINKQLTFLPDSIGNLTNLTRLELSQNQLTSLPDSFGNLTNLRKLDLNYNPLTSFDIIGNLTNLTELDLSLNQLTYLPDSIGNLTNLIVLRLSYNQLTELPESILNLTNLTKLDLSENQLTSLPEWIGNLTNLTYLGLSQNELTSLPDSIGNLTNLKRLSLSGNPLASLPDSLDNLNLANFFNQFNKAELDRLGMSHLWDLSNHM